VTITRAERDALYAELLGELSAIGDVYVELNRGNAEAARRMWRKFDPELQLLDCLGWRQVEPLEEFELDLDARVLERAIAAIRDRGDYLVAQHFEEQQESLGVAHHGLHVIATCRRVLAQLAADDERGAKA